MQLQRNCFTELSYIIYFETIYTGFSYFVNLDTTLNLQIAKDAIGHKRHDASGMIR